MLLFDAPPQKNAKIPGGNAKTFSWHILKRANISVPWILAGGINRTNVAEAIRMSEAKIVDVSSGVEIARGQKDPAEIKAFIELVKTL